MTDINTRVPKSSPGDDEDISFSVMPHDDGGASPEVMHNTPHTADEHVSLWRHKSTYVIAASLILITLVALAYFLLGTGKENTEQENTVSKLPKIFLQQYFGSETCSDQAKCGDIADPDNDGLSNYDEFIEQTDPTKNDTDNDGLADGDEVNIYLTNPTKQYTDPRSVSQESGYHDGSQIKNNYDPLTPGLKMTESRISQINSAKETFKLHEPTISTLAASSAPQPKSISVNIVNNKFDPVTLTVNRNDTVVWLNKDTANHQIASDPHPSHTALPDLESGTLATNQTYSYKFLQAGTFTYHDHLNPTIKATIIVQ